MNQQPPIAKKNPKVDRIHGDERVDDYFWLRDKSDPEVASYLEAENAYTDSIMKPTEAFQETLYKEMLARIKETDVNVPYRDGAYYYYSRTEKGKQYSILCRKKGSLDAPEEVVLDQNQMAEGLKFFALGAYTVSDDGNMLAFSTDVTGFRQYTLQFKDLRSGRILPDRIEKTGSVTWAADHQTVFYSVEDPAKRHYRLYRHRIGTDGPDDLVFEEKDERFSVGAGRTRSRAYILMGVSSHTASEWWYLPADQPTGTFKLISPRETEHEYDVDHHGDLFYIRTNDQGRHFRLVTAPVSDPQKKNWKQMLAHRPDVMLEGVDCFRNHTVLYERQDGLPHMRITDLRTGEWHRLEFPEPVYTAGPGVNHEFDTPVFRYTYQSLITPNSVFDYAMDRRSSTLLKQTEVLGGYDKTQYQSERLWATAKDGVRVPLSIAYKKGFQRDGRHPMFLIGYGSYGYPYPITFSSNRLSLLDRGVVFAIAHIRGGGDLGKTWHDHGKMQKKMNTFTDFIASAEHLIGQKYTSKDRLVIEGGSAGGLLMGAVANLRPDLFKAVVSHVPFVDVINTMLDASLPLTVGEYEEWGNPNLKEEYEVLKQYCPYTNLKAQDYPTMLIRTSFNDSQVMYWEPAKYVAKLRTLKTDRNPLLLKTNMAAGHGGSSGRYDYLREVAFDFAFILTQLGIPS